jgi:transposase
MNTTIVAVDLAKSVFQLAVADASWHVVEQHRLTRSQFERWFVNRNISLVIMEACGGSHYWARRFQAMGHSVKLISANSVKPFVKGNKNDRNDAEAICEAASRPKPAAERPYCHEQSDSRSARGIRNRCPANSCPTVPATHS